MVLITITRLLVIALLASTSQPTDVFAQDSVKRLNWGDPDLQGTWDYRTATPLEKPDWLGLRTDFDSREAEQYAAESTTRGRAHIASLGGYVGDEPWADRGTELTEANRGSLIIDPPSGKLPPRTEHGESLRGRYGSQMAGSPEDPEDRTVLERCIIAPLVPLISLNFNNNVRILQTPDYVVIVNEMIHDTRIVPLNSEPEAQAIPRWSGHSVGHWEGNTLVVNTSNFRAFANPLGTSPDMQLVERFTLDTDDTLIYQYTVSDPTVFEQAWTARQTMRRTQGQIYEYACHEGNRSMGMMLRGARLEESALPGS